MSSHKNKIKRTLIRAAAIGALFAATAAHADIKVGIDIVRSGNGEPGPFRGT